MMPRSRLKQSVMLERGEELQCRVDLPVARDERLAKAEFTEQIDDCFHRSLISDDDRGLKEPSTEMKCHSG